MEALRERWRQWREQFSGLARREKLLVFLAVLAGVALGGWQLMVTPVLAEREQVRDRTQALEEEHQALATQRESLSAELDEDPNEQLERRAAQLQRRLDRLDTDLEELTTGLISPEDMVAVLRDMLSEHEGVELQGVSHQAPRAVSVAGEQVSGEDGSGLYAHSVRVVISGEFKNLFRYFQALEAMDDRLGWRTLDYRVTDWPRAEVSISLQTLSLYEEWLGV